MSLRTKTSLELLMHLDEGGELILCGVPDEICFIHQEDSSLPERLVFCSETRIYSFLWDSSLF